MTEKIKIAVSGCGNRSCPKNLSNSNWLGWFEQIKRFSGLELCGVQDPSEDALNRVVERGYVSTEQTYRNLDDLLSSSNCRALVVTSPAEFHAQAIEKAIARNMAVLVEKPLTNDWKEGEALVEAAEQRGTPLCVVQNWRSKSVGLKLRETIRAGKIGNVGHLFFRYVRDRENPQYPAYIFEEKFPLLYAMGIHHLDLFRFILDDEIESVAGQSFKPSWSLYKSDTGLNLFLKTKKNVSIIYTGTISSPNRVLPQESLIVEGEKGTLMSESQWLEPPLWLIPKGSSEKIDLTKDAPDSSINGQYNFSDEKILQNFYAVLTAQEKPLCSGADALLSVKLLEACRDACETGKAILIDQPLPV